MARSETATLRVLMDRAQQRVDLREVNRYDLLEAGDPTEAPACVVFVRQFPQRDQDIDEAM